MQKLTFIYLKSIGAALILAGLTAAYYGPNEIFVFYLFSEGGKFHYEGFGIGSFWFAALAVQNTGYYICAALFIPVGIGHIKLRRWALTLTRLYIWFWMGAGILFFGSFILLIPSALNLGLNQDFISVQLIRIGISLLIGFILLPLVGLLIYHSAKVNSVFAEHDKKSYWTERYPFALLALLLLFVIMIIILHFALFFQGLFPMFGQIMLGRSSVEIIALCILILGILMYGAANLKKWSWWGSIVFILLLLVSSAMSFSRYSFYDIILMMNLPAYELDFLNRMAVIHDCHLTGLVVVPLVIALGLIGYLRRYFWAKAPV